MKTMLIASGIAGIGSCFEGCPYSLEQIHVGELRELWMNVSKAVYTDPVARCDSGRISICVEDYVENLCI